MKRLLSDLVASLQPELLYIYRWLHQHPELSGEEKETAHFIEEKLQQYGIQYRSRINGYGILAEVVGTKGNSASAKVIALRADMDALPIEESESNSCRSLNHGVMHACGHDFHCAALLGALIILQNNRHLFSGTIKGIFQPSEERYEGGAMFMIDEGVLENPKVDLIFGLHAEPKMEVGKLGFCPGNYMASTDEIHLEVVGKGGHAAMPQETVNPIMVASDIMMQFQEINNKENNKGNDSPFVLNFGKFVAGNSNNVIPDRASVSGTLRLFNEEKRTATKQQIATIAQQTAAQYGATCMVNIIDGYPVLENDEEVTRNIINMAKSYWGDENICLLPLRTTAEDFSYFLQRVPGTFFRVGTGNSARNIVSNLHTTTFSIDEQALAIAVETWLMICWEQSEK